MNTIALPLNTVAAAQPLRLPQTASSNRGTGLAVVIGVHLLFVWALTSGLARQAIELVRKPIDASIILPETPPPPPPKVEKIKDVVKVQTPPPAYVPPPEVRVEAPPAPTITAVKAEPPKEPVVIEPPAPPAPPVPEAKPAPVRQEISLACPGYKEVVGQMLEEAMERVGLNGTVRTRITIRGNQTAEVTPQSGPKEYYKYVQAAVKRMKCSAGGADEVQVTLDINFR